MSWDPADLDVSVCFCQVLEPGESVLRRVRRVWATAQKSQYRLQGTITLQ